MKSDTGLADDEAAAAAAYPKQSAHMRSGCNVRSVCLLENEAICFLCLCLCVCGFCIAINQSKRTTASATGVDETNLYSIYML